MIPRVSTIPHPVAMRLAETEYTRCAELFRSLRPADWTARTVCPAWDVRQMACHMLGMVEATASPRELIRQQRKAARAGGVFIDALTQLQVDERADWTPQRITERFAARAGNAAATRRRIPAFIRRRPAPETARVNGADEPWTVGYGIDTILTRDPWMHRLDIATAIGATPYLTADHDGVIVADVVTEWAERHGKDFTLALTGPAGGTWTVGANGPEWTLDAVDFCRATSRRPATVSLADLMNTEVAY